MKRGDPGSIPSRTRDMSEHEPRRCALGKGTLHEAPHSTQHSRSCYKAFNRESDYNNARATCSSDGGTLAMPRDAVTNTFLINLKNAVDNSAFFRFGLTDIQQEGRWVWEDGATLGHYSPWGPGEPNNDGNEDCAEYWPENEGDSIRNTWNDGPCSYSSYRKFICQVS
ncbi:hypothetical protein Bbelb_307740 [Branchiostoma belcheri]|nr:hypothetical protein Bbelb_307740 [Branchiostoma belcheri]